MLPMLADQRIRMQQVRRRVVRTALHSRPTPAMGRTSPEKKELAMTAGEEVPMLTRQP